MRSFIVTHSYSRLKKRLLEPTPAQNGRLCLAFKTVHPKDFKHFYRLLTDTHTEYMGTWVKCTFRCACGTGEQCQPTQRGRTCGRRTRAMEKNLHGENLKGLPIKRNAVNPNRATLTALFSSKFSVSRDHS